MAEEVKVPFEKRLERLNEIVTKIENETLPLEETMKLYEEGKTLVSSLEKELNDAKNKIESLENK